MRLWIAAVAALALPMWAGAQGKDEKGAVHVAKDVAVHRIIAAAHEAAAKCLEAGKPEKECHAELARACKGHGIGKYCGMRHRH